MGAHSNRKGKRNERKACKLLESLDDRWQARRSQQFSGDKTADDSADIVSNIPGIRWEVKSGKNKVHLYHKQCREWIRQAKAETPEDKHWAILRKKDYQQWMIIFEINGIICQTFEIKKAIEYLSHDK